MKDGIFVGYGEDWGANYYKRKAASGGDGHLIMFAPPRSGKFRDILATTLLSYSQGSCIVIDPKGQMAAVTGPQRARMGQRVIILNPFHILPDALAPDSPEHFVGLQNVVFDARFNPMAGLDPSSETFGADCDNIADSIVLHDGGRDDHWNDSARLLISGLVGHLAANELDESKRNLAEVRKAISSPSLLVQYAQAAQGGEDKSIAEALEAYAKPEAANKGELASIISTARTQTGFLRPEAIAASVAGSDFCFEELKERPTTVYLTLPVRYMASCGKWFRLVLASALNDLLKETRGLPVLCVIDEFAQLGRLAVIENTLGLAAGMGLQLWPVLQDLTQLQDLYPKRWESFLGCAGLQIFFTPRENTTANYVCELCGETTIYVDTESSSLSEGSSTGGDGSTSLNFTKSNSRAPTKVKAASPQVIRRMGKNDFIFFWDGMPGRGIAGKRKPYWEQTECRDSNGRPLYCPDPYHLPAKAARQFLARPVRVLTA